MPLQLVVYWPPAVLSFHQVLVNHWHELLLLEGTSQQNVESALFLQLRACSVDSLSQCSITLYIRSLDSYDETITFIGSALEDSSCFQRGENLLSCRWGVPTRLADVLCLVHNQFLYWMRYCIYWNVVPEKNYWQLWEAAGTLQMNLNMSYSSQERWEESKGKVEGKTLSNLGFLTAAKQEEEGRI